MNTAGGIWVIGCVEVRHFRARMKLVRRPELADRVGVIIRRSGNRSVVVDHLPAASSLVFGKNLEQALSLEPDAVVLESDEPHYQDEFDQVLQRLDAVSDRVEPDELGLAYVGLAGLEAMHGGEAQLHDALIQAVSERLQPRIGVVANKFTSFVAARVRRSTGLTVVL